MLNMKLLAPALIAGVMVFVPAAATETDKRQQDVTTSSPTDSTVEPDPQFDYAYLRSKIAYGQASLAEVRRALRETDPYALSNTVHALFAMRWHRGVIHLLNGMWAMDRGKYPELAWELVSKPPVRIALASTINRIRIVHTEEFLAYIRNYKNDDEEFNRAQVSVALGFNGAHQDLSYLQAMCDGNNHYVAQSAVTALSLFGGNKARDILIELSEKHQDTPRGDFMKQMLRKAYHWPPAKPAVPATSDK